jgi:hypothetical protein
VLEPAHDRPITLEGILAVQLFGDEPDKGDVNKANTPEPTSILKLDGSVCATSDDFPDAKEVDRVQIDRRRRQERAL